MRIAFFVGLLVLFVLATADRCNFPQYHPTRVKITRDDGGDGIYVQRPLRVGDSYKYNDTWTRLEVQGMGYSPVPTGWELGVKPNGDFYGVEFSYIWKRDLQRMKDMGVNVIRVWNWNFMRSSRHQAFLDELYDMGMYILVPFMMGTLNAEGQVNYKDLHSVTTRQKVIQDWTVFVASHSNHPAVLGYLVGNEVEKTVYQNQMDDFFSLLNLMVDVAHDTEHQANDLYHNDTWHYHPITSPFAADTFKSFYMKYYDWLNIDFWALQLYSDNIALHKEIEWFGDFMNTPSLFNTTRRYVPLMLTERGFSALTNKHSENRLPHYNESYQTGMLDETWTVLKPWMTNGTALGVCIMEWNDEWWKGTASDVQNKGCPNPYATVHANCSTVITGSNSSFKNMTLVFEEWLGICAQEDPKEQPIVNSVATHGVLRYIFEFIVPTRRYCIVPRGAYFTLMSRWANKELNPNATYKWCGEKNGFDAFTENPVVLVWLPSLAVLIVSIIIAVNKCGMKVEKAREKAQRQTKAATGEDSSFDTQNASSTSMLSIDHMPLDDEELLPTVTAFSSAKKNMRLRRVQQRAQQKYAQAMPELSTELPLPYEAQLRHLEQVLFDKIDVQSIGATEVVAKEHIKKCLKAAFDRELDVSKFLAMRFGSIADGQQMDGAEMLEKQGRETNGGNDELRPMCMEEAPAGVQEAVRVIWFRTFEGYGLWLEKVHGTSWSIPTGSDSVSVMIQQLVLFELLRAVCGTMNHSPELMMLIYHDLLTKDSRKSEKAQVWTDILDPERGLMNKLYDSLKDASMFMSLDDYNILGLNKNTTVASLIKEDVKFTKSFPERGGLHTLVANYSWLIRLVLWSWIFGWYMQPVHLGKTLCLNRTLTTLATFDSALYALSSLCVVFMIWGSPLKFLLVKSIVLGFVHFLIFVFFAAQVEFAEKELNFAYGLKVNISFLYVIFWMVAGLLREIYLFSYIAYGEHKVRGTYAESHGKPRLVFGIALALLILVALVATMAITQGGNEHTANVALGLFDSGFLVPFVLVIVAVLGAPLASRITGKYIFKDTRSVVEFAPVMFWMIFAVLAALINIFWLVPSVTNLHFTICECQTAILNLSAATCDWRNTFACDIAVLMTWTATFLVSFVVGYVTFVGCSLACGIGVAKLNQIGSVRDWEDIDLFGNDIILNNFKYLTWAAEDPKIAGMMWNAFVDSMYKEYLLELKERDAYMFQVHSVQCFKVLGEHFTTFITDEEERRVVCECINIIAQQQHDALLSFRSILVPEGLGSGMKRRRKRLLHRLRMALSANETLFLHAPGQQAADFAKVLKSWGLLDMYKPIDSKGSEGSIPETTVVKTDDLESIMNFFHGYSDKASLKTFLALWNGDGATPGCEPVHIPRDKNSPKELENALTHFIDRAFAADFQFPPKNEEAARRCIHQLWSVECVKHEVQKREKIPKDVNEFESAGADQYYMRQAHRVATMPSCTTIIPYYSEGVVYEFDEVISTFDMSKTRVSYLEYLSCQYAEEWTNFVENETWRLGKRMPDDPSKRAQYCAEFLDKCLRADLTDEQKHRICMFVTYRGQTLGRTLRGLEALRHGMKVVALLEEVDAFRDQYCEHAVKELGFKEDLSDIDEVALHEYCSSQVRQLVDSKYQVIVAAQVYTPVHLRTDKMKRADRIRDEQLDKLQKAFTFDIVCNHDQTFRSYHIPFDNPRAATFIERPGLLRVSKDAMRATEGKPENQLHAIPFATGEVLNTFDMNQDDTIEMGFKHPLLVGLYWNPKPKAFDTENRDMLLYTPKYRIVGFAEHTYTRPLSLVGELMGAAEFCFVTITQRVLAKPLGVRAHYGHPDYVDGYWARTRGGMSKASNVVNVNEDIFCGYEMISRGQKITFVEWMQAQKGRESAFTPAFVFESKLAGGAGQQIRSRDVFFLNQNLDIFSRLSVSHGTVGFYIVNFLMGASIHYFIWSIILFRVANTTFHQLGIMQAKIAVAWAFQLGYVLAFPLLIENFVERGLRRGLIEFFRTIIPSVFFFVFHLQTKFYYFLESIVRGKAGYKPTGRGFCIDRVTLLAVYKTFGQSHIHDALTYLIMLIMYRYLSDESAFSLVLRCLTIIFICISWFSAPLFFQPNPSFHQLSNDWKEVTGWLGMPAKKLTDERKVVAPAEGDISWEAWHINELVSYWRDEETYYSSFHLVAVQLVRSVITYLPWICVFLVYITHNTMYLVILIFFVQVLHMILTSVIDKSQHHYLSVIELLTMAIGIPCALYFYASVVSGDVSITDIAFGACIYLVAGSYLLEMRTLVLRQVYRIRYRSLAPTAKELNEARTAVAMKITPYKQAQAGISIFILYLASWFLCWFSSAITSINYSAAAAFAWERIAMHPPHLQIKKD